MKFYICPHCGNIITKINDSKVGVVCCGSEMEEMIPGTSDGAHEKHVPVYTVEGNLVTVKVGEVEHPMDEDHYIAVIELIADGQVHKQYLNPGDKPEATFKIPEATDLKAREFCTIHGLWQS